MDPEQKQFHSLVKPPARLNFDQAAWSLGFQRHDIAILVAIGLLKPLGNPPASSTKYIAACVVEELRNDTKWLARASDAIHRHWKEKNARKAKSASRVAASLTDETI